MTDIPDDLVTGDVAEEAHPRARSVEAARTAAARVAVYLLAFVSSLAISRALEPEGRGSYYVLVTVATTAVALGHLSVHRAQLVLWSDIRLRRSLAANAVLLGLTIGGLAAVIAWAVVTALGPGIVPVESSALLVLVLVGVPVSAIALYLENLLALGDRLGRANGARLLAAATKASALLVLWLSEALTVGAAVTLWVVAAAVPLLVSVPAAGVRLRAMSSRLAARSVRLSLPFHIGTAAIFLLFRVDVFILNAQVPTFDVGLYSLAVILAELAYLFTDPVAQVVLPNQAGDDLAEAGRITAVAARVNLVVGTVVAGAVVLAAPVFVPLVYGSAFEGSVEAVVALAPGVAALSMVRPIGAFLTRLERPGLLSGLALGALGANVALNLILIPPFGIAGAGIASSITYAALAGAYLVWLRRAAELAPSELVPRLDDFRRPVRRAIDSWRGGRP